MSKSCCNFVESAPLATTYRPPTEIACMPKDFPLRRLFLLHIFIIVLSNYAVQIPITVLGIETTVGTFTFPFVFVTTDLTVRLYGAHKARKVIFCAMLPALVISYFVGTLFAFGQFQGFAALGTFSIFVFRIAAASFGAYIFGQLADILVFQRLRKLPRWWPAPAASSIFGNLLDTFAKLGILSLGRLCGKTDRMLGYLCADLWCFPRSLSQVRVPSPT